MHKHNFQKMSMAEKIICSATRLESFGNKHVFDAFGLTTSGYKILHIIYEHKVTTPSDILNFIGGTKSNITQRINYLAKLKYVKKITEHSKFNDKRKTIIQLTNFGKKRYKDILKSIDTNSIQLDKLFNDTEKKTVEKLINKLNIIIDKYEQLSKI